MKLLPEGTIPVMVAPPAPVPTQESSASVSRRPLPRATKPIGLPHDVIMSERGGSDVEVEELLPHNSVSTASKGKGRLGGGDAPKKSKKVRLSPGTEEGTASKRDLQDSPSREDSITKRPRTSEKTIPGGIDLGKVAVMEGDLVQDSEVPRASEAVRSSVSSKGEGDAHPLPDLRLLCLQEEADLPGHLGLSWTGEDHPLRAVSRREAEMFVYAAQLGDRELAVDSKVRARGPATSRGGGSQAGECRGEALRSRDQEGPVGLLIGRRAKANASGPGRSFLRSFCYS